MSIRIIYRGRTSASIFLDGDATNSDLYEIVSKRFKVPRRTLKLTSTDDFADIYTVRDDQEFFQFVPIVYADVPYMEHLYTIFESDETKKLVDNNKKSSKSLVDEYKDIILQLDKLGVPNSAPLDKLHLLSSFGFDPNAEIES